MSPLDTTLPQERIAPLATGGYHIALRVEFAFPAFEHNSLPGEWVRAYTQGGYMLDDPITRWVYENTGIVRWSALDYPDPRGILDMARDHGLPFGAAASVRAEDDQGIRSYASLARTDREFTDAELDTLLGLLTELHETTVQPCQLTDAELETLQHLAAGLIMKEIAYRLGISESAVKQRLSSAKSKLSARTTTQAVMQATQLGWLR